MDKKTKALALQYDSDKNEAPIVKAKGSGQTAEAILEIARENKIPIMKDPNLESLFSAVPVGEEIPIELYETAAQLLAFIYTLKKGDA
jgi:flagellar biosynthesis protein